MVDKKIIDWIKSEEAQGYSEEQLKQSLLNQGYTAADVDEAVKLSKEDMPSNQGVPQNNSFFMVLSSILLWVLSILLIIFLGAFPLIQTFLDTSNITIYIWLSLFSLVLGLLISFLFNKRCANFKKYVYVGISFSSILAVIFAINHMITNILDALGRMIATAWEGGGQDVGGGLTALFNFDLANAYIGFALSIIFFNVPFFYYYLKREDQNLKLFFLYLIPIAIFFILIFILGFVSNYILTKVA
ncbi:MAG: hypothetical protein KAS15_06540 [Nanoarchaeota archaeon]|nr:hypothetical protein [Nanoarchaeota archaeon]MCK5629572.1 hypothetical protein [Nanoarchaeota archaeon]